MAAKKKTAPPKKGEAKQRKGTCIQFLRELYSKRPTIGNSEALELLLSKFPESNASTVSISTWKNMIRAEGMDIPRAKQGSKVKAGKKTAKVAKVKKSA